LNTSTSAFNAHTSPEQHEGYTWVPPTPNGRLYGCHNRKPFASDHTLYGIAQKTGQPISVTIVNRLSMDCRYAANDKYNDKGCHQCKHKLKKENT